MSQFTRAGRFAHRLVTGTEMDEEIRTSLAEWRRKTLYLTLLVVTVVGLPAFVLPVVNAILFDQMTPLVWVYVTIYVALVGLVVFPRLGAGMRGWAAVVLAYGTAIASLARLGMVGSGRLYLIVLPIVASMVIGVQAGYVTAILSIVIYVAFAALAQTGVLATWITVPENPLNLGFWIEAGAALAVFLVSVIALLNSFYRLYVRTLNARKEAGRKLEQTAHLLMEQEERLALVLEGTNDGIWDWDIETDDVYFSPRWKGMLGYEDHEIANRFEEWRRLIHPDDVGRSIAALQAYLTGQTPIYELEHRLQHKDGTYRWILARAMALRNEQGKAYRMAGSHTDITARVQAAEEIRRQNDYLAALHETALGIIGRLDVTELLETTVRRAIGLVGASFGWVYLLTPGKDAIQVEVGTGIFRHHIGLEYARGEGLAGTVWENGEPLAVDDYTTWPGRSAHFEGVEIGPSIGVPLRSGSEVVGVVGLSRDRGARAFRNDEMLLMTRFAHLASIALDNARLHTSLQAELSERVQAQTALNRQLVSEKMLSSISTEFINIDPEKIDAGIHHALESMVRLMKYDRGHVFLFSTGGERVQLTHEWCKPGVEPLAARLGLVSTETHGEIPARMLNREIVLIASVDDMPAEAREEKLKWQHRGVCAVLCVPMVYRGTAIGWMGFDAIHSTRPQDEDSITLIRITSEVVANALEHQRSQRALRESEARFRAVFERAAIGIGVTANDGRLVEANPALIQMFGYDEQELRALPSQSVVEQPLFDELMAGRRDRYQIEKRYRHKDGHIVWGRLTHSLARGAHQEPLFAIGMVEDITEQKEAEQALQLANQTLERRVSERTRELSTLLDVVQAAAGSLELDQVFGQVAHGLTGAVGIPYCGLYLVDEIKGQLIPMQVDQVEKANISSAYRARPLVIAEDALTREILESRRPVTCYDAQTDPRTNKETARLLGLRSILGIPFVVKDRVAAVAMLVTLDAPCEFTAEQAALAWGIVNAAAISIENARLYKAERDRHAEAERRREVAEGLRGILAVLNSDRPRHEILDHIIARAVHLLGADAGLVFRLDPTGTTAFSEAWSGWPEELAAIPAHRFDRSIGRDAIVHRRPIGLSHLDNCSNPERLLDQADWQEQDRAWNDLVCDNYRSYLGVPLIIKDRLYGGLGLYYRDRHEFSEEDYRLGMSIADQTALAIENAQLRSQSEQAAAITERSRLARELHDSVTQSLYSVTLYAEAAARLLSGGKTGEAADHLRELRDTAQEALREMRLLIFELRPPILEKSGLAGAIQARLDAVETRGGIAATLQTTGQEQLTATVQQELYHIAHEALNNTLKHARARSVAIRLEFGDGTLLEIQDDGAGFGSEVADSSGGQGLRSIRERADKIGGTLEIRSELQRGTTIRVFVPKTHATTR